MKKKIIILSLLCVALCSNIYGKEYAKEMNKAYSVIRGEIVKNAFRVFNENFPDTVDASIHFETTRFFKNDKFYQYDTIQKKNILKPQYKPLLIITLGNMPPLPENDNNEQLKKDVTKYLDQAVRGCKQYRKDTIWAKGIRNGIESVYTLYCREAVDVEEDGAGGVETTKPDNTLDTKLKSELTPLKVFFIAFIGVMAGGIMVIGGVAAYCYFKKKKKWVNDINDTIYHPETGVTPPTNITEEENNPVVSNSDVTNPPPIPPSLKNPKWILLGASVKGNGHIQSNMPCQDNHKFESIGDGWGVAVVSDGAGSASHSELGSKVVTERGVSHFKNLIEKEGWLKNNTLPTDMEWWQKSYDVLKTIRNEVALVAKKYDFEVKSLSATCLAVIYSPLGLLAVHVGDGRMGYKSMSGEWKAMMTPHKGEEANQTIFLVSDFWSIPNCVLSGVLVPESIVVREPVKAFTLMSDGCENTSWQCVTLNQETGKYYDQNKPFERFFNPLEETLISFQANNVPNEEQQAKWNKFIESGINGFVREQDDKTMIYGYCCSQQEIDDYIEKSKNPAPLY